MRSPASVNRITVTGDGSSELGVGSSSANAELSTRWTPNNNPSPPTVAPPKIKPRLEMSFIAGLDGEDRVSTQAPPLTVIYRYGRNAQPDYFAAFSGGAGRSGNRFGS